MKIDEVSGLFQVQFVLDMAWFDSRLKFKESFLKWIYWQSFFVPEPEAENLLE